MTSWLDIIVKLTPAIVALVVGLVASGIAFLQFRIARDRLRLDLFTKRLEAYEKLQEFFVSVMSEGTVHHSALRVLSEARYKSRFIFGPEIDEAFATLWKQAVEMRRLRLQLDGSCSLPVGPERTAACDQEEALLNWMADQMNDSPNRYSKYLHFS